MQQTKEKEFSTVTGTQVLEVGSRRRRRIVALVVGMAALAAVAIGGLRDDGGQNAPARSTEPVIPFILTGPPAPPGGGGVDG